MLNKTIEIGADMMCFHGIGRLVGRFLGSKSYSEYACVRRMPLWHNAQQNFEIGADMMCFVDWTRDLAQHVHHRAGAGRDQTADDDVLA